MGKARIQRRSFDTLMMSFDGLTMLSNVEAESIVEPFSLNFL
jgi:hypothetical protein